MKEPWKQWLTQADYDMDTAEYMLKGGRCFYAVFMCHLSIEKAIKGLFQRNLGEIPPKTHNLIRLLNRIGTKPPEGIDLFLVSLNEAQVATRYPEDLQQLQKQYTSASVRTVIDKSKEVLQWIKTLL